MPDVGQSREHYTTERPYMPDDTGGDYLTAQDIADRLGVSVYTVRRAFRAHEHGDPHGLPGRRVGKSWVTTEAAFTAWQQQRNGELRN